MKGSEFCGTTPHMRGESSVENSLVATNGNCVIEKRKPPLPNTPEIRLRIQRLAATGNTLEDIHSILSEDFSCKPSQIRRRLARATENLLEAGMVSAVQATASANYQDLYNRAMYHTNDEDPNVSIKAINGAALINEKWGKLFGLGNPKVTNANINAPQVNINIDVPRQDPNQRSGAQLSNRAIDVEYEEVNDE